MHADHLHQTFLPRESRTGACVIIGLVLIVAVFAAAFFSVRCNQLEDTIARMTIEGQEVLDALAAFRNTAGQRYTELRAARRDLRDEQCKYNLLQAAYLDLVNQLDDCRRRPADLEAFDPPSAPDDPAPPIPVQLDATPAERAPAPPAIAVKCDCGCGRVDCNCACRTKKKNPTDKENPRIKNGPCP
ncbi:MAG TPA: hypothetical protein VGH74_15585 [Planctomycetaceae bacterium]|jgi:hypothetical protein